MSRSGYSEDYDERFPNEGMLYQASVERAIQGRRGQAFLRELIAALDAMPERKLIAEDLEHDGAVCAIGSVGVRRGLDMSQVEPTDAKAVAKLFGIAECMARQIVFENDEGAGYWVADEDPEKRWHRMRDWAERHLNPA